MNTEIDAPNRSILNETQAAEFLEISTRTLQAWRVKGGGPQYTKLGRSVRYRQADLDAYVVANLTSSTSAVAGK